MRWPWQPPFLLRTVIVNLKDDHTLSIRGVLETRGAWYRLLNPVMQPKGEEPFGLPGDIWIHGTNISFIQEPPV